MWMLLRYQLVLRGDVRIQAVHFVNVLLILRSEYNWQAGVLHNSPVAIHMTRHNAIDEG